MDTEGGFDHTSVWSLGCMLQNERIGMEYT